MSCMYYGMLGKIVLISTLEQQSCDYIVKLIFCNNDKEHKL